MQIEIPEFSLVVLIGASSSGKSTFARRHFKPTEILSSDFCRGLVSDDENDLAATADAFDVLRYVAGKRLAAGRLTVVDATNVDADDRKPLIALARAHHALPVAIVLDPDLEICRARHEQRPDRDFNPRVLHRQRSRLRAGLHRLAREGFRHHWILKSESEADAAQVTRQRLWCNRRDEHGPFDIIGDVHGCCDELEALLAKLGYVDGRHPDGRRVIFLGDLVDRGPRIVDTLNLAMSMVAAGQALCLPGNHENKLLRKLRGKDVRITHGLQETLTELEAQTEEYRRTLADFLDGLVSHLVLDDGRLVVAHAGLRADLQGRGSKVVREFALYGETSGETDAYGMPVRHNWAAEYRGRPMVVYGHTPVPQADWLNNTICVDTGCVFGGALTALRYPERELVSVPAARVWFASTQPAPPLPERTEQQRADDILDLDDVLGRRLVHTRLLSHVKVREENAAAALEVMSRFAVNPRWLVYLPPTMSPGETSARPHLLEHPDEVFAHSRNEGVARVMCQEKHMGSRAVVVVCRDGAAAGRQFGVVDEGIGIVYTRTGRRFFDDHATEAALLAQVRDTCRPIFDELQTDWLVLDCELMPWSAKAQGLLRSQYAPVGAAAHGALSLTVQGLELACKRLSTTEADALLAHTRERLDMVASYERAWRGYCWPVDGLNGLQLAPFHVMAGAGAVFIDRDHRWHMNVAARLAAERPSLFRLTRTVEVDLTDEASCAEGVAWWETLTAEGGEGMVVKPLDFVTRGRRGLVQPAIKCRGREYLRIIYGPEYTRADNLERLRPRRVFGKRSLALREFALGIEGLERFVRGEPLRRVHECSFAVLALESEPVDPRL